MNRPSALEMAAWAGNPNNYIAIEDIELTETKDDPEETILAKEHSEQKRQAWLALSEEAKQVVALIIDCPEELTEALTTCKRSKKICFPKVLKYLRNLWGERTLVKKVELEIKTFVLIIQKGEQNE